MNPGTEVQIEVAALANRMNKEHRIVEQASRTPAGTKQSINKTLTIPVH